MSDGDDSAADLPRLRLELYIEALAARMPQAQFKLLMDVLRMWSEAGGGTVRLRMDDEERELFTSEVRAELLAVMGLIGAMQPGREDRSEHVVADLGDGAHVSGAMSLVPPEVAADPERLRAMRDKLDVAQGQRARDRREVEAIAEASGMAQAQGAADPPEDGTPDWR
ncbi:hypothetical protein P3T36_003817 [Kitasatospora sp. MAP12-15]|uniref:hypothetical protein n=1 Tax=unclassified Kitasatospora TaxID=2633591 RepID=UPI0024731385|nr:hypothetical protein [Kitasatospora sp. MAP12-44]MDH6112406.1 hypothetical protein [Kitasatospora sp. MAP12-44]